MKIFKRIEEWLNNLWIVDVVDEIRDLIFLYKTTTKNKDYLSEYDLRLDWLGRPYTVVNVPENVIQKDHDTEAFIILQLRKYDAVFIKLGLTEIVYPEITRIEEKDAYAFLLAFKAKTENLKVWKIIIYLIKYAFVIFLLWILIILIYKNTSFFTEVFDFFKNLI